MSSTLDRLIAAPDMNAKLGILEQTRFILVTGSCFGAGKTSLSAALCERLEAATIRTRLLLEHDLLQLELFARFDDELCREDPAAIHTLLEGVRALIAEENGTGVTWIIDAVLPGWFWLLGRYPFGRIEAFSEELADVLHPFRPLIVYLTGDVDKLFDRAVAERGENWREDSINAIRRWQVPLYPGWPVRSLDGVLRLFTWLDQSSCRLLDRWSGDSLLLDASVKPIDELVTAVLEKMGV